MMKEFLFLQGQQYLSDAKTLSIIALTRVSLSVFFYKNDFLNLSGSKLDDLFLEMKSK